MEISFDVGGTFTDIVIHDPDRGLLQIEKLDTEQIRSGAGIAALIGRMLLQKGLDPAHANSLTHATTLPSNMVIERSGARVGLIVNRGFRDILELGFESRFDLYNFAFPIVEPLVPRRHRYEVSARVLADGTVTATVDRAELRKLALLLEQQSIRSVAVCLLHSYRFPQQEELIESLLRDAGYNGHIELSHRICPEIREYPRMSTTVLNAYITPMLVQYLESLSQALRQQGIKRQLDLMTSHGGHLPAQVVERRAVELLESGAAATVLAAAALAKSLEIEQLLSFEMGGTTAKIAIVLHGKPLLTDRYEVARLDRSRPGSGLPVQMPAIDLIEIGAGGGSIASLNSVGLLSVGPESAGSSPGPACYARGGTRPTVTDACLLLGYLSADGILDGAFPLEQRLAEQSIREALTCSDKIDPVEMAEAVYDLTTEMMANTVRVHLLEHGLAPEDFTLIANGGAGPLFAAALASRIGINRVVVMPHAGVGSAIGMLNSPPSVFLARSRPESSAGVEREEVRQLIEEMREQALSYLEQQHGNRLEIQVTCKMRYQGQGHELSVPVDLDATDSDLGEYLHARFEAAYQTRYGRTLNGAPSELLGWQLEMTRLSGDTSTPGASAVSVIEQRQVNRTARFSGQQLNVAVIKRKSLKLGQRVAGPVIVEERETTTIIPPKAMLTLDRHGNLIIDLNVE